MRHVTYEYQQMAGEKLCHICVSANKRVCHICEWQVISHLPHHICVLQMSKRAQQISKRAHLLTHMMMMIAFITFKSSLVPLFEGL